LLCLVLLAGACARQEPAEPQGAFALRFEDRPAPGAFDRRTTAVRDSPDGAAGYWAAVPALPRPERAEVVRLEGRRTSVVVALFAARGGAGDPVRLSGEAADALGIDDAPVPVRITALRTQAEIEINRR
jgi:hypothetical protein